MTIGIGFQCNDGVALCADRQFTSKEGRYTYQGSKLGSSQEISMSFVYTYAGDPDQAKVMFGKVSANLANKIQEPFEVSPQKAIRDVLEEICFDTQTEGLQTLLGVRWRHFGPHLYRTSGTTVVEGLREYIGYGDSSALRYISEIIPLSGLSIDEATVLGTYMVFVAGRFVDQCGEEADHIMIHNDGTVGEGRGVFDNQRARFFHCESRVGERLRGLLLSGGRDE